MKILITGVFGFVGSNIALYLKKNLKKSKIYCLDNLTRAGSAVNRKRLKKAKKRISNNNIIEDKIGTVGAVALDKNGKPTTDPKKALEGMQLPIADFKGSGLAWVIDILSGVFTGANHGGKVKDPFDDFSGPQNIGHMFIVFKSNLFVKNYNKRIKENIKRIKKLPKLKGVKKIYFPGENKSERFRKNFNKNINIPKNILTIVNNLNKS